MEGPLETLMSLIDKNSATIPEGDYIAMCDALKKIHGGTKPARTTEALDDALTDVVLKIRRLKVRRDAFAHWTVLTDEIMSMALTEYAVIHRLDSLRTITEEGFEDVGLHVDFETLYANFMASHNGRARERRERLDEEIRVHEVLRDDIMRRMVA